MIVAFISGLFVGVCATLGAIMWVSTFEDDPDDPHTLQATQEALENERAINERLELRLAEIEQHSQGPAN